MKTSHLIPVAFALLFLGSGCVVHADSEPDRRPPPSSGTTTTTTTTTTETHSPAPAPIPDFIPMMSAVSSDVLESDPVWETSWQAYTMQFSDVADTGICSPDLASIAPGSVVTIHMSGFEIEDEYAACPTGSYLAVPDCDLWEGEACVEILWRDVDGFEAGTDYATDGRVDVTLEPGRFIDDPYVCHISTRVDGHPDMSFDFSMVYDPYELSPGDRYSGAVCTL